MTAEARRTLLDCEQALDMLTGEHDPQRRRIMWAAARALVFEVGVRLRRESVDRRGSNAVMNAYRRWRAEPDRNAVFWSYINSQGSSLVPAETVDEREEEEICEAAILWWHQQLRLIEREVVYN